MAESLSKAEKLLLAAADLEERGIRPFSAEDLVVEAWRKFPDAFALVGYPEHPDSNRVYVEIMGKKPLRSRGWIVKAGQKRYQLSEAGNSAARSLRMAAPAGAQRTADLGRKEKVILRRMATSRAFTKSKRGDIHSVIFPDACVFWDISARSVAKALYARLTSVEAVLDSAARATQEGRILELSHGSDPVGAEQVRLLIETHELLVEMFAGELDTIRARSDERLVP